MKNRSAYVAVALAFVCLYISSGHALAQPYPQREYGPQERQDNRLDRWDRRDQHRQRYSRFPPPRWEERGAGPDYNYYRGGRMPYEYRSYQYVVEDWDVHGLRRPPRGYHWIQSGNDYVLVAIATGIILELMLGR